MNPFGHYPPQGGYRPPPPTARMHPQLPIPFGGFQQPAPMPMPFGSPMSAGGRGGGGFAGVGAAANPSRVLPYHVVHNRAPPPPRLPYPSAAAAAAATTTNGDEKKGSRVPVKKTHNNAPTPPASKANPAASVSTSAPSTSSRSSSTSSSANSSTSKPPLTHSVASLSSTLSKIQAAVAASQSQSAAAARGSDGPALVRSLLHSSKPAAAATSSTAAAISASVTPAAADATAVTAGATTQLAGAASVAAMPVSEMSKQSSCNGQPANGVSANSSDSNSHQKSDFFGPYGSSLTRQASEVSAKPSEENTPMTKSAGAEETSSDKPPGTANAAEAASNDAEARSAASDKKSSATATAAKSDDPNKSPSRKRKRRSKKRLVPAGYVPNLPAGIQFKKRDTGTERSGVAAAASSIVPAGADVKPHRSTSASVSPSPARQDGESDAKRRRVSLPDNGTSENATDATSSVSTSQPRRPRARRPGANASGVQTNASASGSTSQSADGHKGQERKASANDASCTTGGGASTTHAASNTTPESAGTSKTPTSTISTTVPTSAPNAAVSSSISTSSDIPTASGSSAKTQRPLSRSSPLTTHSDSQRPPPRSSPPNSSPKGTSRFEPFEISDTDDSDIEEITPGAMRATQANANASRRRSGAHVSDADTSDSEAGGGGGGGGEAQRARVPLPVSQASRGKLPTARRSSSTSVGGGGGDGDGDGASFGLNEHALRAQEISMIPNRDLKIARFTEWISSNFGCYRTLETNDLTLEPTASDLQEERALFELCMALLNSHSDDTVVFVKIAKLVFKHLSKFSETMRSRMSQQIRKLITRHQQTKPGSRSVPIPLDDDSNNNSTPTPTNSGSTPTPINTAATPITIDSSSPLPPSRDRSAPGGAAVAGRPTPGPPPPANVPRAVRRYPSTATPMANSHSRSPSSSRLASAPIQGRPTMPPSASSGARLHQVAPVVTPTQAPGSASSSVPPTVQGRPRPRAKRPSAIRPQSSFAQNPDTKFTPSSQPKTAPLQAREGAQQTPSVIIPHTTSYHTSGGGGGFAAAAAAASHGYPYPATAASSSAVESASKFLPGRRPTARRPVASSSSTGGSSSALPALALPSLQQNRFPLQQEQHSPLPAPAASASAASHLRQQPTSSPDGVSATSSLSSTFVYKGRRRAAKRPLDLSDSSSSLSSDSSSPLLPSAAFASPNTSQNLTTNNARMGALPLHPVPNGVVPTSNHKRHKSSHTPTTSPHTSTPSPSSRHLSQPPAAYAPPRATSSSVSSISASRSSSSSSSRAPPHVAGAGAGAGAGGTPTVPSRRERDASRESSVPNKRRRTRSGSTRGGSAGGDGSGGGDASPRYLNTGGAYQYGKNVHPLPNGKHPYNVALDFLTRTCLKRDDLRNVVNISLRDPLTRERLQIPVRGSTCEHIECFDYEAFMARFDRARAQALEQLRAKNPHAAKRLRAPHDEDAYLPSSHPCPVCRKPQARETLYVDGFLERVLQSDLAKMTPNNAYVCLHLGTKFWIVDAQKRTFVPDMSDGGAATHSGSAYRPRARFSTSQQRGRSPDTFQPVGASASGLGTHPSGSPRGAMPPPGGNPDFQRQNSSSSTTSSGSGSASTRYGQPPNGGGVSPRSRGASKSSNNGGRQFQYDPSNHSRNVPPYNSNRRAELPDGDVLRGSAYRGDQKFLPGAPPQKRPPSIMIPVARPNARGGGGGGGGAQALLAPTGNSRTPVGTSSSANATNKSVTPSSNASRKPATPSTSSTRKSATPSTSATRKSARKSANGSRKPTTPPSAPVTRRITRSAARRKNSAVNATSKDSTTEKASNDSTASDNKKTSDTPTTDGKSTPSSTPATGGPTTSTSSGGPPPLERPSEEEAARGGGGNDEAAVDDDMADFAAEFAAELDAIVGDGDNDLIDGVEDDDDDFDDRVIPIKLLNEAKVTDLAKIPKVSTSDAEAIVSYREENGDFAVWEDLMKVRLPLEEDTQTRLRVSQLKSKKRLTKQSRATLKRLETKLKKAAKGVKVSRDLLDGIRDGLDVLFM